MTSEQYRNFEELRNQSTIDELLELVQHKNSVVKGYSSWALADKMYPNLATILAGFIQTGETATIQSGCLVFTDNLASVLYHRVFYQHVHDPLSEEDSLNYQTYIQRLDSVVIYSNTKTSLLGDALSNNNGNPQTYDRIRELAFNRKNSNAIEALGVYQRKEDVDDFKRLKKHSFPAIAKFPNTAFWEFLLSFKDEKSSLQYLMALSAFKTRESALELRELSQSMNGADIRTLSEAIIKNYCVHYQDLILSIWEQYGLIDFRATTQVSYDIPEKSAKSFSTGLLSNTEFHFVQYNYDYGTSDKILPLMLDQIRVYAPDSIVSICKQHILTADFMFLGSFLKFSKDNLLTETSDEILNRLQQKNRTYEDFHLAETLLSFKNPAHEEEVVTTLRAKQQDWDWGNWSDHFRKLFREHNIEFDQKK